MLNSLWITLLLNQVVRFAVPLFFLISGFVLELNYDYHQNYFSYLKKRLSKILIPYFFWSVIYYSFIYTQNRDNFIKVLLTGDASYQLYFIPTLLIFYLIFPLIHKFKKYIINFPVLTILAISQIYLLNQDYFVKQYNFIDPVRISLLTYFVFILGVAAAHFKDYVSKKIYFLIIPILYLAYYIFEEGKNLYYQTFDIKSFYSQWRPSVLIYTIVIFIFLFYIFDKSEFKSQIAQKLSKLSFLVFFIHVIVLEIFWPILGKNDIIFFVIVSGVSFGIAYLVHKIPYLAKITG